MQMPAPYLFQVCSLFLTYLTIVVSAAWQCHVNVLKCMRAGRVSRTAPADGDMNGFMPHSMVILTGTTPVGAAWRYREMHKGKQCGVHLAPTR